MQKWRFVILFGLIALIAFTVYLNFRTPPGVEPMSDQSETVAKLGLWTAIAGALAGFFSLLKEIIGLFKKE